MGGDSALEELENEIQSAIEQESSHKVLSRKMLARPGLNPDSLQAQIDLFSSHGGSVLGPYTVGVKPTATPIPRLGEQNQSRRSKTSSQSQRQSNLAPSEETQTAPPP